MKQNIWQRAESYLKARKNRRHWYRVINCLAMIVALLTTSLLTLPAVTLEQDCVLPEHVHTQECYEPVTVIKKKVPICTLEGDYVHKHDELCYDEDGELWCKLSEKEPHQHDESCFPETESQKQHEHSEACYVKEKGALICEQHEHSEACYGEIEELVCGQDEEIASTEEVAEPEVQPEETENEESTSESQPEDAANEETVVEIQPEDAANEENTAETQSEDAANEESVSEVQQETVSEENASEVQQETVSEESTSEVQQEAASEESTSEVQPEVVASEAPVAEPQQAEATNTERVSTLQLLALEAAPTMQQPAVQETTVHQHEASCYQKTTGLICDIESEHKHEDTCYEWKEVLSCETSSLSETELSAEMIVVQELEAPTETTVQETEESEETKVQEELTEEAPTQETEMSTETEAVQETEESTVCDKLPELTHQHGDACFEIVEIPVDPEKLTCTNTEEGHEHTALCYGEWELVCELKEHIHEEACNVPSMILENKRRVENMITMIDNMASCEEIQEQLDAYEEAGDQEGYEAYYKEVSIQILTVYAYYEELDTQLQQQVTNSEKLCTLHALFASETLEITDLVKVYQINDYNQAQATLVYGGSAGEILDGTMSFKYWDAVVVEADENGDLYLADYITADGTKTDYKAESEDGFVLFLYNTNVMNITAGQRVVVDFDYKTQKGYRAEGYGSVTFVDSSVAEDDLVPLKMTKTNEFIEVNLYDYGANINKKYESDKNWPGFQQDKGEIDADGNPAGKTVYSSNFGNSITSDLEAGLSGVTIRDGQDTINDLVNVGAGYANSPLSGRLKNTLSADGYPVLNVKNAQTEYKLDYLWSDNTYATKVNKDKGSIDGLFQRNETTGEYYFNSRLNHAQYDAKENQFVLYNKVITSNVIWYPFGNFLPFNNIETQAVQSTKIDRAYLVQVAKDAAAKSTNTTDAYKTLSTAMNNWISKMDGTYSNNWKVTDALYEYFNTNPSGPGALSSEITFTDENIKDIYSIDFDEATDFFFGMEISMDFVQAANGLTGKDTNGDGTPDYPMVFKFIGDDDVWVYVDGKLTLDLSGIHRHVAGTIDFQKGIVSYYNLKVATGDVEEKPYKTVTFAELGLVNEGETTFKNYSEHTFKMYYMERGAGSGVCSMNFNMPLVQKNTIALTKRLTTDSAEVVTPIGDKTFKFQILNANEDGSKTQDPIVKEGTEFNILDKDGNFLRKGVVGKNGIFTLEARETAVFPAIEETHGKYYVRELFTPATKEQYNSSFSDGKNTVAAETKDVTIDGITYVAKESLVYDIKDGTTLFAIENQAQVDKLGKLSITKELISDVDHNSDTTFEFEVTLDGEALPKDTTYQVDSETGSETRTVTEAGKISLKAKETAVISNILAGTTFTVKETAESADGYTVSYQLDENEPQCSDGVSGVINIASEVKVLVYNSEHSVTVEIPVVKNLEKPNGKEHNYKLALQQVTDKTGETETENGYYKVLELPTITIEPVEHAFTISYPEKGTLPGVYYYKITEIDSGDQETAYDTSVYVVEVTVEKDADDTLKASITGKWKDGVEYSAEKISFTNLIICYMLPETGGVGTTLYTASGLALIFGAALCLIYIKKESRKELKK